MHKIAVSIFLVLFFLMPVNPARGGITDSTELQSFLDGVIETFMDEKNIAGAVVSVVHEGEIFLEKGYGYADVEEGIEVDPSSTMFRIASISKLFTWLSVMQLAEEGSVDLDRDVNEYLDFSIPETYEQPVTLRSLMSHTPGFEERLYRLFAREPGDMLPMDEILPEQLPKRVRPPLRYASYSNHGTGVAQYVVERITGVSFEEYAHDKIIGPLGMTGTTFRQPLPDSLEGNLSKGYASGGGKLNEMYFEYIPMKGVGGASSSARDMAKFMNFLLDSTCTGDYCLLDSASYSRMKEPVVIHSEGMNPARHGFSDMSRNDTEIIGHGGATFWFHSILAILPEHNTGIFVSFNSSGGSGVSGKVLEKFAERYYPDPRPLFETVTLQQEELERFTGSYFSNRRSHSDFFKIRALDGVTEITTADGKLRMVEPDGETTFWLPVDETTFRKEDSNERIAFEMEEEEASYMFKEYSPFIAFERITRFYNLTLHRTIIRLSLISIFYILIIWPGLYLTRLRYRPSKRKSRLLPADVKLPAWLCAACIAVSYILIYPAYEAGRELVIDIPAGMKAGMMMPFPALFFLLFMIWRFTYVWNNWKINIRNKLFCIIVIIVFFAALWQLHFWNLLGWRF